MIRTTVLALLVGVVAALGVPAAPVAATAQVPKVVLVVGPVGAVTPRYRALAERAARVAEGVGADVVRVYSPNATWPVVRDALAGASIVVYLGHGNGWPSPYRDSPYPPTQNGFGLNPVAGQDDDAHQYFGEAAIGKVRLARHAVVLLHHLCYASGNSEPGLREGTQAVAIQRVDNYAAGFLRAGAEAVVAEGHLGPAPYVRSLLESSLSVDEIFASSPTAHGNAVQVASERTPGYTITIDPDGPGGGYYRSLVSRGLTAAAVRAGAAHGAAAQRGVDDPLVAAPPVPSLVDGGVRFQDLSLARTPVARTSSRLLLPVADGREAIPADVAIGVRWEPVLLEPPLGPTPGVASIAPDVSLVQPEQPSTLIEPLGAKRWKAGLAIRVRYPDVPGLYRLVPTIHDPSGVAYDPATQALLRPLIVRVMAPVAVAYGVVTSASMAPDSTATLGVRVVNAGATPWERTIDHGMIRRLPARLVATWVSTTAAPVPGASSVMLDADLTAPGHAASVEVGLVAPSLSGDYLLVLDIDSPALGPLSAIGATVGIVRMHVGPTRIEP